MNKWFALAGIVLLMFAAGCVPSLHPLYTEEDLVYEPNLVGTWEDEDSETWTFTKSSEKEYNLATVENNGRKGSFIVHLVKVKGRLFLDLYPEEPVFKENMGDFYEGHLLKVHTFMRIEQIQPTLRIAPLDSDWIRAYLKKHPKEIRHEKVDDGILLTAQPKALQSFLIKHEKTKDAFGELSNMIRK